MQNLNISCEAVTNVDIRNRQQIDITLNSVDLGFLDDIPVKDIIRNVDMVSLMEEFDEELLVGHLESLGYEITKL